MRRTLPVLTILGAMLAPALFAEPAQANSRSWVSKDGNDANPCTISQPCATWQHAHDVTVAGGEVSVLTPGDYGSLVITKAISITNDGSGESAVTVSIFNGIAINAAAGDIVSLRGLILDGFGSGGAFGIQFNSGNSLHIQNCVIRNFEGLTNSVGLTFQPTTLSSLFMSDSIIYNNGNGASSGGIFVTPAGTGSASVTLDRVHIENNVVGLKVDGSNGNSTATASVTVRDSVISGNAGNGLWATSTSGKARALVFVKNSAMVNNTGSGVQADGGSPHGTVILSNVTVARNKGNGVSTSGSGAIFSYGNNNINNNDGIDVNTSLNFLAQK